LLCSILDISISNSLINMFLLSVLLSVNKFENKSLLNGSVTWLKLFTN